MKPKITKLVLLVFLVIFFAQFAFPTTTLAIPGAFAGTSLKQALGAVTSTVNCLINPIKCALGAILAFAGAVAGALVAFTAMFLEYTINLSTQVMKLDVVQTGFSVSLAMANLLFVLGIIFIAFATMFRSQTYGLKKLLLKLILIVIIANFSLVLAGVVINFADKTSLVFLDKVGSVKGFMLGMISRFAPQNLYDAENIHFNIDPVTGTKDLYNTLIGLIFIIIFTIVIALSMLAMAIMFFLRYLHLAFLLILMPLALIVGVFPFFHSNFEKWTQKFLRWTFFGPICIFFLYLATSTTFGNPGGTPSPDVCASNTPNGTACQTLAKITDMKETHFANISELLVLLGLSMGGLFAANSLSIMFAATAYGTMKGAVKGYGKMLGYGSLKGTQWFTKPSPTMQRWAARPGGLVRKPIGVAASWAQTGISRGITAASTTTRGGIMGMVLRGVGTQATKLQAAPFKPLNSFVQSMKVGSGLFNKPRMWMCNHCKHFVQSKGKPTANCPIDTCVNHTYDATTTPPTGTPPDWR